MDPFRYCHRNTLKGCTVPLLLVSAASIHNRSFRCLGSLRTSRFSLYLRTLKTAHPDFFILQFSQFIGLNLLDQVLDRLVSPSSKHYCSFTGDLSPDRLSGVLLLSNGTLLLEVGFTLRCLQRLSAPHFASLLCRWHDNSCTSDASTPVLSY